MVRLSVRGFALTISPGHLPLVWLFPPPAHLILSRTSSLRFPDIEPYSSWVRIGAVNNADVHIAPEWKQPFFNAITEAPHCVDFDMSPEPAECVCIPTNHRTSSLDIDDVVQILRQIGCTAIRVSTSQAPHGDYLILDDSYHPLRHDNLWTLCAHVTTHGITLLRGEADNGAVRTRPALSELGQGFGSVDISLPTRSDGIFRLCISQSLLDLFERTNLASAGRMDSLETLVEISVRAAELEDAKQKVRASGFLNWLQLLEGGATGHRLEERSINIADYVRNLQDTAAEARRQARAMGDYDQGEAIRMATILDQNMGHIDTHRFSAIVSAGSSGSGSG
ncbi:uncharacterized protein PFL1_01489 [Pseudozyma flocculosa PF-1]|uniref:uncharacterized protein n=1 Tax=Pseudozyma flocculosa PF-1 TaxID=1277687 RepID=UPI0004560481|nr:uncharacterized protein PFL1_01489 [Pseudozyma flocculosa PF-1]EPQ31304.1 hypothetical protein PFL1_01489 [Pseudozyma flocculosa PF-1]